MAVILNKLTDSAVRSAGPGDYGDGGGLYLQVTPSGSKSWVFRYKWRGKTTRLGLGAVHAVSLKEARHKAASHRKLLADDINPRDTKTADIPTFGEAFEEFVRAQGASWDHVPCRGVADGLGHRAFPAWAEMISWPRLAG